MSDSENDEHYREKLEHNRLIVVQSLDMERHFMLSYLRSNSVLDEEDCEIILNAGTSRQQKTSKFLDVVATRGKRAYQCFVNALEFEHAELYEKFTGNKPSININSIPTRDDKKWADYDRDYLTKELAKISEQYSTLAYMHNKIQAEKQEIERNLIQTTSKLHAANNCIEELQYEIKLKDEITGNDENESKEVFTKLSMHCQSLTAENAEKSNIIIVLQAQLLAVNEDRDKLKRNFEEIQIKNKGLHQQVKDLIINYDFQRTQSMHLQKKFDKSNDELNKNMMQRRELQTLKFKYAKVNEDKDDLGKRLDEYRSVVTALNARLSLLNEQKTAEYERRSEISEEYLKLRQEAKIFELERDQAKNMNEYFKDKIERIEKEGVTNQEQILFLKGELEKAVNERNRSMKEREEVTQYNNQLIKSRDEAIQNQIEVSRKLEERYKEVARQLDEAKNELKTLMLKQIRNSSSKSVEQKCAIFEGELEKTRQSLTLEMPELEQEDTCESKDATEKCDIIRTSSNVSVLEQALESLRKSSSTTKNVREFTLDSRQLSLVYNSLSYNSFSPIIDTFTTSEDSDDKKIKKQEKPRKGSEAFLEGLKGDIKRRIGSNRGLDKYKTRSKSTVTYETVKAICPLPLSSHLVERQISDSTTPLSKSNTN